MSTKENPRIFVYYCTIMYLYERMHRASRYSIGLQIASFHPHWRTRVEHISEAYRRHAARLDRLLGALPYQELRRLRDRIHDNRPKELDE